MTTEQEKIIAELALAHHKACESYQVQCTMNTASDPTERAKQAVVMVLARARMTEAENMLEREINSL